jgi:hypothetical protein
VAKALEVDSAAKSAEKDRKAREKRSSKEKNGNGGTTLLNGTIPTTSSDSASKLSTGLVHSMTNSGRILGQQSQPTSTIEFQVSKQKIPGI